MAEGTGHSRYVKLTKDQGPLEDIKPGELNQPIEVPQLAVRKCYECGQPLPESFQPPGDEPWTTGIFGCAEDRESCWTGLFCPCVLFGRNVESLREDTPWTTPCMCHAVCVEGGMALAAATAIFHGSDPRTAFLICEGLLFAWWMCGIYTGLARQSLQKKYHLKLAVRKCYECGQPLPESFQPPGDEPWTTGIFGCAEDRESCWTGLFCPCVLFGRNVESLREDTPWTTPCMCHAVCVEGGMALAAATAIFHGSDPRTAFLICEGLLFAWWMCGIYTGLARQSLQKKYHLKNSPCDPCLVHCCMHWCALCQEHREMKGRLSDNVVMPMTIVNPPPVQEMNPNDDNHDSAQSSANNEHTTLEMQAL
nr:cell number regulator 6 [Quercus suber]